MPPVVAVPDVAEHSSSAKINQAAKHAPKVCDISDTAAAGRERGEEGHTTKQQNEPFGGDWKDDEDDDSIRKQDSVGCQYSVNRSRRANRGDERIRRKQNRQKSGPDTTDEEELRELAATPQ